MEVVRWGGEKGGFFMREGGGGGWDRKLLMIYWEGGRNFCIGHHKNVSQTSHYSYNIRLFSFQLKDIHKITSPRFQIIFFQT